MSYRGGGASDNPDITSWEMYVVQGERTTVDLIVWQRYHNKAPGVVEAMMDGNPQIAVIHQTTFFLPPGTYVMVPIFQSLLLGRPTPAPTESLWSNTGAVS